MGMGIREFFEAWSSSYERAFSIPLLGRLERSEREKAAAALAVEGKRVLDIGCGYGKFSGLWRARNAALAVGLDFSPGMVARARARCRDCHFLVGDASRTPFKDGTFDAVTCMGVMNYYPNPGTIFREMRRVGREFLLTFPQRSLLGRLYSLVSGVEIFLRDKEEAAELCRPYFRDLTIEECAWGLTLVVKGGER